MSATKDREAAAIDRFAPYRNQDSVMRLREVVLARIEVRRDKLEREESERTRGRLEELRDFLKLLSE